MPRKSSTTKSAETIENEIVNETVAVVNEEESVDSAKTEYRKPVDDVSSDKDAEIENLKEQLAKMQELMAQMAVNMSAAATPIANNPVRKLDDEVTIVHLVERSSGLTSHIELSNTTIDLRRFGEERILDRRQFEELVGKYRSWFERGIIAVGAGNDDMAKRYVLKTVNQYSHVKNDFIDRLSWMDPTELVELYEKLCDEHKHFIIGYFRRKVIENDPAFCDLAKLNLLNVAADGELDQTIFELKNKREKSN